MKRAFVYARVSTGEQAKGFSLEAQFDEIYNYCKEKGIIVVDKFQDSMSGTKLTERLGLMDLLKEIDKKKPNFVIATESDRISRNTLQFGWIDTHLSMKGIKLLLVNERQADGPFDRAFQRIRAVFSEFETDLRQWRINRGREKARSCSRFMNRPPFGYVIQGKEIIPDPETKFVVEKIFHEYLRGTPIKRLSREFNKSPSTIRYVLSNEFYINPDLNGKHITFICRDKFITARSKLQKNRKSSPRSSK